MSIKDRAGVSGIGETRYLRGSPSSAVELQFEASLLAAADAGIAPHEIDGVIPIGVVSAIAEDFIENPGLTDLRFSAAIPHGGASPEKTLQSAAALVAEPFRRFDCSLESDGGTEVIVSATERAADLRQPQVFISGVAAGHPDSPASITQRPDMTSLGLGKPAPVPSALLAPYWED